MKKWLIFALAVCLLILAGCGQNKETNQRESLLKEGTYTPDKPDPNNTTYDWGVTMTVENVTPIGCILKVSQSGGSPTGELLCGNFYWIERQTDSDWSVLRVPANIAWTDIGYVLNGRTQVFELNWELLYGTLSAGTYRIGDDILDSRAPGDYDKQDHYTEPFTIG